MTTTTRTTRTEQALILAAEYSTLMSRGDVVLAEQARRTIDDLVGRWQRVGGHLRYCLPSSVRRVMESR